MGWQRPMRGRLWWCFLGWSWGWRLRSQLFSVWLGGPVSPPPPTMGMWVLFQALEIGWFSGESGLRVWRPGVCSQFSSLGFASLERFFFPVGNKFHWGFECGGCMDQFFFTHGLCPRTFPFGSFWYIIVRSLVTIRKEYCLWETSGVWPGNCVETLRLRNIHLLIHWFILKRGDRVATSDRKKAEVLSPILFPAMPKMRNDR